MTLAAAVQAVIFNLDQNYKRKLIFFYSNNLLERDCVYHSSIEFIKCLIFLVSPIR